MPRRQNEWKPAESIAAIVFSIIALVLFNGFPDLIAIYGSDAAGNWQRFPILAQGRWRLGTNLAQIGVKAFDVFVLVIMISGPKLLTTGMFMFSADAAETFNKVISAVNPNFHWILVLAVVGCLVEIGRTIYRTVRDKP